MKDVVSVILGGGQGSRLWPLTQHQAKPAVPVAGKFRLIDVPISNSLHAGIDQIYVLTQFNSASLHRHIAQTYRFDAFRSGAVNILAAEQSLSNRDWYQGTADAVRKNLDRLTDGNPSEILILSGDQLYVLRMRDFLESHRSRQADLSIAVKPVPRSEASALGIMRIDETGRIVEFVEKPKREEDLARLTLDAQTIARLGLKAEPGTLLASMGIYTFKTSVLQTIFREDTSAADFGKEIIPGAISRFHVQSFLYYDYWRDIGTIPAFHEANIELTRPDPPLNLYHPEFPIFTHARFLPGTKVWNCQIENSVLCEGSVLARRPHRRLGDRHPLDGARRHGDRRKRGDGHHLRPELARQRPGQDRHRPRLPHPQGDHRRGRAHRRRLPAGQQPRPGRPRRRDLLHPRRHRGGAGDVGGAAGDHRLTGT